MEEIVRRLPDLLGVFLGYMIATALLPALFGRKSPKEKLIGAVVVVITYAICIVVAQQLGCYRPHP